MTNPYETGRAPLGAHGASGPPGSPERTSKLAVAGLVLACLFFLPFVPIAGAILGAIAVAKIARSNGRLGGRKLALSAVIVGGVSGVFLQGLIAAIAIPSFVRFGQRAKVAEAKYLLAHMRSSVQAYLAGHGDLPGDSTGWVPSTPCCEQPEKKCALTSGEWDLSPWSDIGFKPDGPTRYQYRYAREGSGSAVRVVLEARGDLDCDGRYSSLQIVGTKTPEGDASFQDLSVVDELE